jgi:hypothetical protein
MKNSVTEVPLRKRSTPYDFAVIMARGPEERRLYKGSSARYAKNSYWQGVQVATFLGLRGSVRLTVILGDEHYGDFTTEIDGGKVSSMHVPSGKCAEWTVDSRAGVHLAEWLLATMPGVPGPLPYSN